MQTEYEYIVFEEMAKDDKRVTSIWRCNSRKGDRLGIVRWRGFWRQYCFLPDPNTMYSAGCLQDVQHFITQLMDDWKKAKKNKRKPKKRSKKLRVPEEGS